MSICKYCGYRVKRKNRKKRGSIWIHKRCPERKGSGFGFFIANDPNA